MTEQEWLVCTDPNPMVEFLRGKASDRKLRLFAVGCARRGWPFIADHRLLCTVEVAERHAEGLVDERQLRAALDTTIPVAQRCQAVDAPRANIALYAVGMDAHRAARWTSEEVLLACGGDTERASFAGLLRCVIGNPFRPSLPLPADVLAWNDGTVRRLAQGIYDERRMPEGTLDQARLAVLADALLDTGCGDEELIAHCRSEGPHVRGCWALDVILGMS